MPTYNEKTAFVVRNQSTGAPLTTATVQLRRGASTIAMSHIGQGFYTANSVPRGRWEVWIDGVNSGMTHGVGVGKLEDVGHEVGLYPQSQADGWSLVPIDLSLYRLLTNGSFSIPISGTSASFSSSVSVETNASDVGFYSRASGSAGVIGGIYIGRGQRGTLASPTATQSGDGLLWLGGQGYGATGFSSGSRGVIRVRASENWTDSAQGAYLSFENTPTGSTTRITDAVRINPQAEKNAIYLELGTSNNAGWTTGEWLALRMRGVGLRNGDLVYQPQDDRYLFTANTSGTTDLNNLSNVSMGPLTATSGIFSNDLRLQSNLLINNPADTFAYTIVGGAITANRQLNLPVISATDTISVLGLAQTFGAVQTARGWALTSQSNSPATAYTWTLTSGNQANINLASSTGNVTITTASPTAGVYSILRVVGHATLARQVTLTQTGVTFVKAGVASGASIVLDTIAALEEACYRLHWITTTLCFVDRVNSLSGGMTLSGHQNVVTPWSLGSGANFSAVSAGFQVDPVGTYGLHFKGNTLIEQASGQALRLYRATSGATSEVCLPFALQDSLGNVEDYGEICARIDSSTSGAEKGTLTFDYKQNGSLVLGATLNENGFTASQILNSVTISSIYSGLRLNGVTSGTISNYLSHNGIQSIVPFFGGTATLGIDSSAGVTVPVDTTFLVVTSTTKMAFPRFFRTAQSSAIGSAIIEIEVSANLSSSPFTYSFRNRTAFTLGAGGTFNSGIPLVVPVIP